MSLSGFITVALAAALGAMLWWTAHRAEKSTEWIRWSGHVALEHRAFDAAVQHELRAAASVLSAPDVAASASVGTAQTHLAEIARAHERPNPMQRENPGPAEAEEVERVRDLERAYKAVHAHLVASTDAAARGEHDAATTNYRLAVSVYDRDLAPLVAAAVGTETAEFEMALVQVRSRKQRAEVVSLALAGLALMVAVTLALTTHRSVTRRLAILVGNAEVIGRADVNVPLAPVPGNDELATVGRAIALMRERLQAAVERLVEAEKLSLASKLAGGVAHEINNAMAVVRGNVSYVVDGLVDEAHPITRAEQLETLREVESATEHVVSLVAEWSRLTEFGRTKTTGVASLKRCVERAILSVSDAEVVGSIPDLTVRGQEADICAGIAAAVAAARRRHTGVVRIAVKQSGQTAQIEITANDIGHARAALTDPALVNDGGAMRFDVGFLVAHALLHGNAGSVRAERSEGQALYVIEVMIETSPVEWSAGPDEGLRARPIGVITGPRPEPLSEARTCGTPSMRSTRWRRS